MLVTSRGRGKCPICGVPNHTCGGPSNVIPVDERITAFAEGDYEWVEVRPGQRIKMRKAAQNKMRMPERNKRR